KLIGGVGGDAGTGNTGNGGDGGKGGAGGFARGGGLFNGLHTTLTVVNSTFGGVDALGAPLPNVDSNLLVAGNGGAGGNGGAAGSGGGLQGAAGAAGTAAGGGLFSAGGTFNVGNNIIDLNQQRTGANSFTATDVGGSIISKGHNIFGTETGGLGFVASDQN